MSLLYMLYQFVEYSLLIVSYYLLALHKFYLLHL